MENKVSQEGYVSLMAALLISFVLLFAVVATTFEGFESLSGVLDRENKEISFNLALSCLDQAVLRIVQSPSWQPGPAGEKIFIDDFFCTIKTLKTENDFFEIISEAGVGKSYVSVFGIFDPENLAFISVKEI